ncbi:MAG: MHYT domain-containing protein [Pseudomonadota bacterium]|nr:MHYT domain-containing protein [Pseudomonadota bacterium]
MEKDYDYFLVFGSVAIAFLTSFLAIAYASFIIWHHRFNSKLWTYGAAFNMGMGIWTMHFIGMLALHIDTPVSFEIFETILSAVFAVIGSYLAFRILLNPNKQRRTKQKLIAAFILGSSVSAMHYSGMDAMQMFPPIQYNVWLVIISMVIAYAASYIGLEIFIRSAFREKHNVFIWHNLLASIVIGSAIAAMHYTGMAAASFDPDSYCTVKNGISVGPLAAYVVGIVVLILITSFMFIIYEQGQDTKRAQKELETLNANLEQLVEERTQEIQQTLNKLQTTQELLIENEKMASLGGLVAGVAHEVNTPLGVGLTSSTLLKDQIHHLNGLYETQKLTQTALADFLSQSQKTCQILEENIHKAANLISSFKQLAVDQSHDEQIFRFNVYDTLYSSLVSLNHELKSKNIRGVISCDKALQAHTHAGALSQIATNLIMNSAMHAFDENSLDPQLNFEVTPAADNQIEIKFFDNGKGMTQDVINKAFDPFFTTKRGQGGSGLGLHLVYNLVTRTLKGKITIHSEVEQGTTFTILFPDNLA